MLLRPALAALALTALPWSPTHAAQSYDNCTGFIDTLPATISTQGTWCLRKDLSTGVTSGAAITVATNNVTIDCNDFKLGGLQAGLGTATSGIASFDRLNVTVRQCNIRGFLMGVKLDGTHSGGHVVEDNRFDGNTYRGLYVVGDGSLVQRNLVLDTGGSTGYWKGFATGIASRFDVDILDNTIDGVRPAPGLGGDAEAKGITTDQHRGAVSGNRIRGLLSQGTRHSAGIHNFGPYPLVLRDNDLVGDGSAGSIAISCAPDGGRLHDNVALHFSYLTDACTDDGNVFRNL